MNIFQLAATYISSSHAFYGVFEATQQAKMITAIT
jgi:hypothetical protein